MEITATIITTAQEEHIKVALATGGVLQPPVRTIQGVQDPQVPVVVEVHPAVEETHNLKIYYNTHA
jgi:hypothetical protein